MPNKLFGSYIGIVIDTVDPEHLGRVQVFIPSLDCNLINSFTGQSSYIFPGNDTGGDLSIRDLNLLKKVVSGHILLNQFWRILNWSSK